MISIIKRIISRIRRLMEWKPKIIKYDNLITIGSKYGAWTIPENILTEDSVVYLAGAGEDISFDVGIAEKYSCDVHIFDPTPRAKKHFDTLIEGINKGLEVSIDKNTENLYKTDKLNPEKLKFHELGLWNKSEELKFFAPKNPAHVSHSIVNLQKTDNYFTAKVDRLSNIMKDLQHNKIDLLKIDIEGAEYKVIESIIEDKLNIKVLCVEYDEAFNPLDKNYSTRIKQSIKSLLEYGYIAVDSSLRHNYTFILQS